MWSKKRKKPNIAALVAVQKAKLPTLPLFLRLARGQIWCLVRRWELGLQLVRSRLFYSASAAFSLKRPAEHTCRQPKINKRRRFAYPSILAITRERGQCESPRLSPSRTQQASEDARRCDNAQHRCLFTQPHPHETPTRPVPQSQS